MSSKNKKIRVRFAPSPTGFLHIGGLRTALYNFLFAKKNRGDFILRIEDTDRERVVPGGVENIIKTFRVFGLNYDEGPDGGGKFGPYIQSARLKIYQKYADELLRQGAAYHCFCAPEDLKKERETQRQEKLPTKYSGRCLKLNQEEIKKKLEKKMPYVARLKVPEKGRTVFDDLIYGKIETENKNIDHQVLLKSDGYPTYHLANVVDDHLMKITHVIRGEEWLPSTAKHILLYGALGWDPPQFAHLPLILNPDKSKLSKRQGDVAVEDYVKQGFLPAALLNFVALLGWNPKGDEEIYSIKELIKYFDLKSINTGGAVFNKEKLYWMNGEYIRKISLDRLVKLCIPYFIEAELIRKSARQYLNQETGEKISKEWLRKIIAAEQERLKRLDEIPPLSAFFFKEKLSYEKGMLIWKKSNLAATKSSLEKLLEFLSSLKEKQFKEKKLEKIIKDWIEKEKLTTGAVLWPMRAALSGQYGSPSPFEIAVILGKEKTLKRIKDALNAL